MRFRLRTLLIVLTLGPPALAGAWLAWSWSTHDFRVLAPFIALPIAAIVYAVAKIVAVTRAAMDESRLPKN